MSVRTCTFLLVTCSILFTVSPLWGHSYRYHTDAELQTYLATTSNFKILPSRAGQTILKARHQQYNSACGIFSIAPIVEYMGYTRYQPGSSWVRNTQFLRHQAGECEGGVCYGSDVTATSSLDVGYFASPEYIAQDVMRINSFYGQRGYNPNDPQKKIDYLAFLDKVENGSSLTESCNWYYLSDSSLPYGECADSAYDFSEWLKSIGNGCNTCTPTEPDGMIAYFNRYAIFGCKDAKRFYLGGSLYTLDGTPGWYGLSSAAVNQYRKVIKSFIDNHIPLEGVIRYGGHFVTIIGYANLDEDGLPLDIIAVNPHLHRNANFGEGHCPGPRPLYWVFRDMDQPQYWIAPDKTYRADFHICEDNTTTESQLTVFDNLSGFISWMQHLELGCEAPEGWAYKLDQELKLPGNAALCRPEPDVPDWGTCVAPVYATIVNCYRDGKSTPHRQYIIYEDEFDYANHHFEFESRNTTCDDISVSAGFEEGGRRLASATITRQGWNANAQNWETFQTWDQDTNSYVAMLSGQTGIRNAIGWYGSWPENYWLTASGLAEPDTMRRTVIKLAFEDGHTQEIFIGPKGPQPVPGVFINQQAHSIRLRKTDTAQLGVSLDNGGLTDPVDYWLAAATPLGVLFYGPAGWTNEIRPFYQGPLMHAGPVAFPPISLHAFPAGSYQFYFGLDT
ncbi:MAG: hypothetical protein P8Y00_02325, partial [Deltaproteobacteria bacterium]